MTITLPESGRRRDRSAAQFAVSALVHAALIAALVYATAKVGQRIWRTDRRAERINFTDSAAAARADSIRAASLRQRRDTTP